MNLGIVKGSWNDIHPEAEIGEGTTIWSWNRIGKSRIGRHCKITNWVHIGNDCSIGDECNFQPHAYLTDGATVGDRVFFAGGVQLTDIKYLTVEPPPFKEPVTIGNDVVLGNGCRILGGTALGDRSVVGMGAVAVKNIPADEVWIGVPARFHCTREEYDRKKREYESRL